MNRVIFILLLIFVFTKSGAKDHSVNFAFVISGKVHHDTQKSLTIGVQNLAISKFIEFPLKIDSNKMFSGNIKLADSIQDVFVVYKDELIKLLVHSGDSIHMEFESSSLKRSIKFSGNAKEDNRLLIKFDTIPVIKTVPYSISLEKSKALSPDKYLRFCDSLFQESLNAYNDFVQEHKLTPEMKSWMRNEVEYNSLLDKSSYPDQHRRLNNMIGYWKWDVADEYFDFQKAINISDIDLINSLSISRVVNNINFGGYADRQKIKESHHKTESGHWAKPKSLDDDSLALFGVIEHVNNDLLRQLCLCELLGGMVTSGEIEKFEKYQNLIARYIKNQRLAKQLLSYYEETKHRFENPEMNRQAILKEVDGTAAKSIIDSILFDNRGNVIYVDCWAAWCAPCLGEIPYSKELMMKLKDLPVSFLFLCFDSEKDKWRKMIEKTKLGGTHYFISKGSSEPLKKAFSINGYPTYLLFDRNGNIVSNNTFRPSEQDQIVKKIKQLTIK